MKYQNFRQFLSKPPAFGRGQKHRFAKRPFRVDVSLQLPEACDLGNFLEAPEPRKIQSRSKVTKKWLSGSSPQVTQKRPQKWLFNQNVCFLADFRVKKSLFVSLWSHLGGVTDLYRYDWPRYRFQIDSKEPNSFSCAPTEAHQWIFVIYCGENLREIWWEFCGMFFKPQKWWQTFRQNEGLICSSKFDAFFISNFSTKNRANIALQTCHPNNSLAWLPLQCLAAPKKKKNKLLFCAQIYFGWW